MIYISTIGTVKVARQTICALRTENGLSESSYLTAKEAAGELGVSLKTLYACVSRGLIRSEAVGGKRRNRRYRAEDVRRLKERKEWRRNPERAMEGALS